MTQRSTRQNNSFPGLSPPYHQQTQSPELVTTSTTKHIACTNHKSLYIELQVCEDSTLKRRNIFQYF